MDPIPRLRRSRGISIVTAIFLLVVLSGIGVAVVTFATAQRQASAIDLLGTRAYEAARTGVEYGLYQLLGPGQTCASANFAAPGTLAAMTVSVTCTSTPSGIAGVQPQVRITATACNQPANGACPNPAPGVDYVQRVVQVVI
jgi:MSHA biogenesis protein MshP